ncbi:BNR-4 repeat-containing protein, partial [Candidatus Sumerlaeota bacterium]|nr:BNR-4 repeat-containing protein [Candidatus Sumerlaeota bacterium]
GGWCWFQDERAIIHKGNLVVGAVSGRGGDIKVGVYDMIQGNSSGEKILHEGFEQDDHDAPALYSRPDGSVLAMYARHGKKGDPKHYYRISAPDNPLEWGMEKIYDHGGPTGITYMNIYHLPKDGILYNFYRDGPTFHPFFIFSEDHGETWNKGGQFIFNEIKTRNRPYVRYVSNGLDRIFFSFTEAHPSSFQKKLNKGCSIYFASFGNGKFYNAKGDVIKDLKEQGPLTPREAELIFQGDLDNIAWTSSIRLDEKGYAHIGYSVHKTNEDHRYRYAFWDGVKWQDREVAYAGRCLYPEQDFYTGLITLDPVDPRILYISSNVHPETGNKTGTEKYEIYRARIPNDEFQKPLKWIPVTKNSLKDNIRPVCVAGDTCRVLLWMQGNYITFRNYETDIVGIIFPKQKNSP